MPIVSEVPLEISLAELRRLRTLHSADGLHPSIRRLLPEVLAEVEEHELLRPAIAWESRRVLELSGSRVRLAGGSELAQAEAVVNLRGEADELAWAVGSIGPALDRTTRDWFANGREVEAFVLGEIGNLAIGKLSDRIPQDVGEWAAGRGLETSGALSPGGTGVDLSEQRVVVDGDRHYRLVHFCSFLERREAALEHLQIAIESGFFNSPYIRKDPFTVSLHDHPRFKELLQTAEARHLEFRELLTR